MTASVSTHRRGLLLDRDGVINVDQGYVSAREQFVFMDGIFPFLRAARDRGYCLAILTNQSGVARGYYTEDDYQKLTGWMLKEFVREGISMDLVLASFEHGEGEIEKYRRESFWRKPNPGMVLEALERLRLDPLRSVMLGDKDIDMKAAKAGGIGKCLWLTQKPEEVMDGVTVVKNFDEALKTLI